jgi:hypothetical protein
MSYGLLVSLHVVFGLFFSLTIVTALRGVSMYAAYWRAVAGLERNAFTGAAASEQTT